MTVCVAAIFGGMGIVGACDRMLTAGDVQFEPDVPKIRYLTSSCAAMIAGDANFQTEITQAVQLAVNLRIEIDPERWLPIREVADIYRRECDAAVDKIAERRILGPFGLTKADFLLRQQDLSVEFVKDIASELLNFSAPGVEAIVSGIDDTGPHIYTVDNTSMQCHDSVGFAAIGSGYAHANSQMMAFNHTFRHSLADTLMSVLFSKKRAEIAPGVGGASDMYFIPGLGKLDLIDRPIIIELEKRYAEENRRQARVASQTRTKINGFVTAIIEQAVSREQSELPSSTDTNTSLALKETDD